MNDLPSPRRPLAIHPRHLRGHASSPVARLRVEPHVHRHRDRLPRADDDRLSQQRDALLERARGGIRRAACAFYLITPVPIRPRRRRERRSLRTFNARRARPRPRPRPSFPRALRLSRRRAGSSRRRRVVRVRRARLPVVRRRERGIARPRAHPPAAARVEVHPQRDPVTRGRSRFADAERKRHAIGYRGGVVRADALELDEQRRRRVRERRVRRLL